MRTTVISNNSGASNKSAIYEYENSMGGQGGPIRGNSQISNNRRLIAQMAGRAKRSKNDVSC